MEIEYLIGDAVRPEVPGNKIIVHVCNDVGGWGAGFVLALSRRWTTPEREYRAWSRRGLNFELGRTQFVRVETDTWVANMIAQTGLSPRRGTPPIRYEAVEKCLQEVAGKAAELKASVCMPRIGCGLAGGRWEEIEVIISRTLLAAGIPVYVYDLPRGEA